MVTVAGVRKSFGRTAALTDVSFGIPYVVTGLLGPNGAGKTTLLRILATVLSADAGRIDVFGHDPAARDGRLAIRRRLGYVPQEPGFHRNFTTFEFIDYVAILKEWTERRARHDEVRRVLRLVDLDDVAGRKIKALSGGMRRRVALAQALLGEPAFVVLDEPTAGLDPEQRMRFREVVSTLATDRAVLLSTHQTEDVAALCDQVVVMDKGTMRFTGSGDELRALGRGQVWRSTQREATALVSWRSGDGSFRNIGPTPPPSAALIEPTVEDAYLLLLGRQAVLEPA